MRTELEAVWVSFGLGGLFGIFLWDMTDQDLGFVQKAFGTRGGQKVKQP